jgi:hypothetical protein
LLRSRVNKTGFSHFFYFPKCSQVNPRSCLIFDFAIAEKNFGTYGNLNFITGAGGYLQNFVYGYAGLRYTDGGLRVQPVLPPHNITSMKLRAVAFAGRRLSLEYDAAELKVTVLVGGALQISAGGSSAPPVALPTLVTTVIKLEGPHPSFVITVP